MPEQQSRRGNAVTPAAFEGPFDQHRVRFGTGGLNLHDSLDVLEGWARLTNVDADENGDLTGRAGQTTLATGGAEHHSVQKLRDPQTGVHPRFWGIDSNLYRGVSGALTQIDSGYSGFPLTLVPHRPPLSGDPWVFVADSGRMRKARADGLVVPIGLPAPGSAAGFAFAGLDTTLIAQFDASDGTEAAVWVPTAGTDTTGAATGLPLAIDETGQSGGAVEFQTVPGTVTSAYDAWWGTPFSRNLNTLGGGARPASDDDLIHFWLQIDRPEKIEELRLYLVVSGDFSATQLPGTDPTGTNNTIGYVKAIRQYDFARYLQGEDSQINVAGDAILHSLRDEQLEAQRFGQRTPTTTTIGAQRDTARTISVQASGAAREWVRFGYFEIPLRRGDFQRFGTSAAAGGPDWGTVTGAVIYLRTVDATAVKFRLDEWFLHGGVGIDSTAPGSQPYDWRYTHYDPRTGAEGNPSPEAAVQLDVDRKAITVTPAAYGDGAVRQRVYRRGGSLIDDWYFVGVNGSDGGAFVDEEDDAAIVAAGTVQIDHFQPVPTVTDAGVTVLAQPLPALWGPIEGMLMGCGDPYRPGHVYFSLPGAPDHWSSSGNVEVCPPSEELLHGGVFGHQGFVFSRDRLHLLYPNLSGAQAVTAVPSLCKRGLAGRWAFTVGPGGIFFVAQDGIFQTSGGPEDWLSRMIDPLFKGKTVNGYLPIDFSAPSALRLTVWESKLYFLYQDTSGARQVLVYDLLLKTWRSYAFGRALSNVHGHDEDTLLLQSLNLGKTYTHDGTSDDGLAIAAGIRSGAFTGSSIREEKLFGDQFLDAAPNSTTITVQNYLNEEAVANAGQGVTGTVRARYILDGFGDAPQKAHSISTDLSWATALAPPILYQLGYAVTVQPDITHRRVTNWDDFGHPDEVWFSGVTLDCDTAGATKHIVIERDFAGARDTVAEFDVTSSNRHKFKFSWPAVPAHMWRIRPDSEDCEFWLLYRADPIFTPEPPRISKWDVHFENAWDQYYTGLDLYCDTGGVEKQIAVSVDGTTLTNGATGLPYFPVTANGRRVVHLTLPWGRGHVFRFSAIDDQPGLLYQHRWHLQEEPSEQANWNQNFSILGTRADKFLKAVIFECDTFGQNKSVQIEVDGAVVETLTINANGRRVVQKALATQQLGRVWRMFPVDYNPGRLYSAQPVFDEEPFQLDRWETQETNHNLPGFFYPLWAHITLKSTQDVTLTTIMHHTQTGKTTTRTYTIPATGGQKQRRFVTFAAGKGVLIKYLLTSADPFWLYREETLVQIQPWGAQAPVAISIFGNSDNDPTRSMVNAQLAAAVSGGGTN